ncbi:MAG: winged helix-turn-helix transcriptional regulator [Methanomethylovorans sp.]|nr:winged helix-turn-helix transcriptional regulator [Methanomethylovorans sp.]
MIIKKVKIFKALSDETRLKILSYLLEHDYCACDFASLTAKDQTTISKHLKVLVEAGLLKYEKHGRNIIYSISDSATTQLLQTFGIGDIKICHENAPSCCACKVDNGKINEKC